MPRYTFRCGGFCTFTTTVEASTPEEAWQEAKAGLSDWELDLDSPEVGDELDREFTDDNGTGFEGRSTDSRDHEVDVVWSHAAWAAQQEIAREVWSGSWACHVCKAHAVIERGRRADVMIERCPKCGSMDMISEAGLLEATGEVDPFLVRMKEIAIPLSSLMPEPIRREDLCHNLDGFAVRGALFLTDGTDIYAWLPWPLGSRAYKDKALIRLHEDGPWEAVPWLDKDGNVQHAGIERA